MLTSNVVAATRRITMVSRLGILPVPPQQLQRNNNIVMIQCRTMAFQKPFVRVLKKCILIYLLLLLLVV